MLAYIDRQTTATPGHRRVCPDTSTRALAINAAKGVFAGTVFDGVYLSADLGDSWAHVSAGLIETFIFALAIDAHGAILAGGVPGRVYLSADQGTTWTRARAATSRSIHAIVINTDGVAFAGTAGDGIFRIDRRWSDLDRGQYRIDQSFQTLRWRSMPTG